MNTYDIEAMKSSSDAQGLIEALKKSEDASIRCDAAEALGQVGDSQAVGVLVDAVSDSDGRVREAAVASLGKLGDEDTLGTIMPLMFDSDEGIRQAALKAVAQINKGNNQKAGKKGRRTRSASAADGRDGFSIGDWFYAAACLPAEHIETWYSDYKIQIMAGRIGLLLGGAILWIVAFWLLSSAVDAPGSSVGFYAVLSSLSMIVLFGIAMKGWDWFSEYKIGTNGSQRKVFVMLFIMMTIIGNVLIAYWTGKGVARLIFRE